MNMKRRLFNMTGMALLPLLCAMALMVLTGCDDPNGGGGEEGLLEVTHVNGFQGKLSNGYLIEIAIEGEIIADGSHTFTLYIDGVNKGAGTLTLSGGSIIAIIDSSDSSLTYSSGIRYDGTRITLRRADNKVWVHWGVYTGATMNDFNSFAQQYGWNANSMYTNRPSPDEEGYYDYDTPQNIYAKASADHPQDAPPISALNQAIRTLNAHKNTGVGAYVSRGNLIAYYFRRVQ